MLHNLVDNFERKEDLKSVIFTMSLCCVASSSLAAVDSGVRGSHYRTLGLMVAAASPCALATSISGCARKDVQLHSSRSSRVVRIRAFSGEGDVEKEEASSSGRQEDGKSGVAGATKLGFGASAKPASGKPPSKEKKKSGTIRRSAPQQPLIQAPGDPQAQQIETAYVASLTFLGLLIFVEGIALAASGFLPEEWDTFLVNTLYPSFTPTVGLFLLGAAGYGVVKYLGAGSPKE